MVYNALILVFCVIINRATTQSIDYITSTPMNIKDSECDSKWDELLPVLKMIKNTPDLKKERLLNVVKMIKFLLSDEIEKNQCDKILEDIKVTKDFQSLDIASIDSIVEERLKPIKDSIDDVTAVPEVNVQNDAPKNKTEDFSKILAKISTALAKLKEQNDNIQPVKPTEVLPIFRSGANGCKNNANPPLFDSLGQRNLKLNQAGMNSMSREMRFNIPCQRAADILDETTYVIPRDSYCDLPKNINLDSILKNPKLNSDNLPFQIVPNSVTCVDADDSIAILFKPKKISFMQVYGNLLKKITLTVLVPYHVSKLAM